MRTCNCSFSSPCEHLQLIPALSSGCLAPLAEAREQLCSSAAVDLPQGHPVIGELLVQLPGKIGAHGIRRKGEVASKGDVAGVRKGQQAGEGIRAGCAAEVPELSAWCSRTTFVSLYIPDCTVQQRQSSETSISQPSAHALENAQQP